MNEQFYLNDFVTSSAQSDGLVYKIVNIVNGTMQMSDAIDMQSGKLINGFNLASMRKLTFQEICIWRMTRKIEQSIIHF